MTPLLRHYRSSCGRVRGTKEVVAGLVFLARQTFLTDGVPKNGGTNEER